MCFNTGISICKPKPEPKIAERDIKVYKVINRNGMGSFYNLLDENGSIIYWEPGYHYIESPDIDGNVFFFFEGWGNWEITKGLHSKKTLIGAKYVCEDNERIVKMIIPKGAKYFENKDEYVSDQLIYL